MFAYAVKMWGKTIGDASMEARGNLMLGVLRRSLHNYFLLESDNKNHVPNFVPNKVTGIVSLLPPPLFFSPVGFLVSWCRMAHAD